ncbi:MAG: GspE/PulE family protein [Candidatus Pacebacteria bacterium]|nr:GspE/PulE family protein [Candidatus Paceibacterota bacterium]
MAEISKKEKKGLSFSPEKIKLLKKEIQDIFSLKKSVEEAVNKNTSEAVESIFFGAIGLGASDVHIEPEGGSAKIRLRMDGILHDVIELQEKIQRDLLARIKLLAGMKLNVNDRPQDGRFSIFLEESEKEKISVEVRVSTLPAEFGEATVMRILNPKSLISLEELGLRKDLYELFVKEIHKPNGMIIITGPTGSGKTTTLYAFLNKIKSTETKIITIEDPIEYHLNGISQTQVNPSQGYDFASGLQSIMRQDPDVILVGEIRDPKTCQISIQAALTGHLVFSTLHTNDAAGTVSRLISLEGDVKNIGPAINLAVAQRLVRKVCKKCSRQRTLSAEELKKIKNTLPENLQNEYKLNPLSKISEIKGCENCNNTGYKGRVGIFEAIVFNDEIEKFILENPSIAAFKEKVVKEGMTTMKQDGFVKVLEGVTTIEEVEKTTGD